jgi:hypothetical protein
VAGGQSNAEIAARLGINDHMAERHTADVLAGWACRPEGPWRPWRRGTG